MPKNVTADLFFLFGSSKMKYNDIPISMNKNVQTGPKTQFGGLNGGLIKELYHVDIDGVVNKETRKPANKVINKDKKSFGKLLILI